MTIYCCLFMFSLILAITNNKLDCKSLLKKYNFILRIFLCYRIKATNAHKITVQVIVVGNLKPLKPNELRSKLDN